MGMILTLFLIHANVYNSVDGPKSRGMSYIEVWMIGTQIPILVALTEYGFLSQILCVEPRSDLILIWPNLVGQPIQATHC